MLNYNPATIGAADLEAITARLDRYLKRHGSEYGESPIPGGDHDEARQVILADWLSADWAALELTYLQRNGKTLFGPTLSELGAHLRAVLFMAGRARVRGWVESGPMRRAARAESRRRDVDDSTGAGMGSRAADPARLVAAVEEAQARGITATPVDEQGKRLRWVKTRNSTGYTVEVIRREHDRTVIDVRSFARFNFRRAGSIPARALPKCRKRIPATVTRRQMLEALTGQE